MESVMHVKRLEDMMDVAWMSRLVEAMKLKKLGDRPQKRTNSQGKIDVVMQMGRKENLP